MESRRDYRAQLVTLAAVARSTHVDESQADASVCDPGPKEEEEGGERGQGGLEARDRYTTTRKLRSAILRFCPAARNCIRRAHCSVARPCGHCTPLRDSSDVQVKPLADPNAIPRP